MVSQGRQFQKGRTEKDLASPKGNEGHKMLARAHTFPLNKEENGVPSPHELLRGPSQGTYFTNLLRVTESACARERRREARAAELRARAAGTQCQVQT